jgi:hypothetical protein
MRRRHAVLFISSEPESGKRAPHDSQKTGSGRVAPVRIASCFYRFAFGVSVAPVVNAS